MNKENDALLTAMHLDMMYSIFSIRDALLEKEVLTREALTESALKALTSIESNPALLAARASYDFLTLRALASIENTHEEQEKP
jgi:hypothetical protein